MKKIFTLVLAATMIMCASSCAKEPVTEVTDSNIGNGMVTTTELPVQTESKYNVPSNFEYKDYRWDLAVVYEESANLNNEYQLFRISFPTDEGYSIDYGRSSKALDGTYVLLGTQLSNCEYECANVEDVFDAFMPQLVTAAETKANHTDFTDFKFDISAKEKKQVNNFEMCKYTGIHTMISENREVQQYFIGYSAQLSNGAYVYWVVFDNSDDQTLKEVVEYDADTMATTLAEGRLEY